MSKNNNSFPKINNYFPKKSDLSPKEKSKEEKIDTKPMAEGLGNLSYNDLYENSDVNPIATDSGNKNDDDDFDLQSELESKFDKLFGTSSGNSNSDF